MLTRITTKKTLQFKLDSVPKNKNINAGNRTRKLLLEGLRLKITPILNRGELLAFQFQFS